MNWLEKAQRAIANIRGPSHVDKITEIVTSNTEKGNCPLCETSSAFEHRDRKFILRYTCPKCGEYEISRTSISKIPDSNYSKTELSRLSREANNKSQVIQIKYKLSQGILVSSEKVALRFNYLNSALVLICCCFSFLSCLNLDCSHC